MLLAILYGELAGCCAICLPGLADYANACEMRRRYARIELCSFGPWRQLVGVVFDVARQVGFYTVRVYKLDNIEAARAMYQDMGL